MKGTIKFFNSMKGYGFIAMENKKDMFFHISGFLNHEETRNLMINEEVEFEIESGERGDKAVKIKKVKNDKRDERR